MTYLCNQSPGIRQTADDTPEQTRRHPCYSREAHHQYARMHLPVAPQCNIGCNYCNRKYDCVNESRPGVTSEILTPVLAEQKFIVVKEKIPNLSVVGIAGPGDALANWDNTREAVLRIKQSNPEMIFCLSTNGLLLPHYAPEIVELGIKHVTVTLCTLDPATGAKIYHYVYYQGKKYEGLEGARILLENQLTGIRYLAQRGVLVKVNIVMIKGINDSEIPSVVKKARQLGAFMTNIMPLIPAEGSAFAQLPPTNLQELNQMRDLCQIDLRQMRHCKQCRADAIGLLGEDRSREFYNGQSGQAPKQNQSMAMQPINGERGRVQ
ncbi:MAG: nitrogenase cofactor biosynthesis protein NifB [Bacillota bacterium]